MRGVPHGTPGCEASRPSCDCQSTGARQHGLTSRPVKNCSKSGKDILRFPGPLLRKVLNTWQASCNLNVQQEHSSKGLEMAVIYITLVRESARPLLSWIVYIHPFVKKLNIYAYKHTCIYTY